jgi:thiosulfate/3-mercaptopyruvate sulfurtransferase
MHIADKGYAQPDALVSTEWVAAHLDDPSIRLPRATRMYFCTTSAISPARSEVDWQADLNDTTVRVLHDQTQFAALMGRLGIANDTTVVFYGDKNNWWATYAYWVFQLFGHRNAKVMDGGRMKWVAEGPDLTR